MLTTSRDHRHKLQEAHQQLTLEKAEREKLIRDCSFLQAEQERVRADILHRPEQQVSPPPPRRPSPLEEDVQSDELAIALQRIADLNTALEEKMAALEEMEERTRDAELRCALLDNQMTVLRDEVAWRSKQGDDTLSEPGSTSSRPPSVIQPMSTAHPPAPAVPKRRTSQTHSRSSFPNLLLQTDRENDPPSKNGTYSPAFYLTLLHESETNIDRLTQQEQLLKNEIRRLDGMVQRQNLAPEYLKEVVLRFVEESEHRPALVPVLARVLGLLPEEVVRLERHVKRMDSFFLLP